MSLRVGTGHEELRDWLQNLGLINVLRRDHPLAREYTGPKRTFFSRIDLGLCPRRFRICLGEYGAAEMS